MSNNGWVLSGEMPPETAEQLELACDHVSDFLDMVPPSVSRFEQAGTALWRVDIYFTEKPDDTFIQQILDNAEVSDWDYSLAPLEDRDWVSESQRLLAPVKAGRFFVFGAHDADKAHASLINLQVDAGQAFGTGKHETTAACLTLLDAFGAQETPANFLDLGTGSGVLAMAACKMWPSVNGTGTDIDPVATEVAIENRKINGVTARAIGSAQSGLALKTADGLQDADLTSEAPYDLIIANILAGPLIAMAGDITSALAPNGTLILSGLLISQQDEVLDAYNACGMKLVKAEHSGEWAALQLTCPAT